MDETYALLMQGAVILLGLCLAVCLFRAFRGPKTADRVVAVNMAGTVTVLIILFLRPAEFLGGDASVPDPDRRSPRAVRKGGRAGWLRPCGWPCSPC